MGKDYYAILGVAKGADDNELKKGAQSVPPASFFRGTAQCSADAYPLLFRSPSCSLS